MMALEINSRLEHLSGSWMGLMLGLEEEKMMDLMDLRLGMKMGKMMGLMRETMMALEMDFELGLPKF